MTHHRPWGTVGLERQGDGDFAALGSRPGEQPPPEFGSALPHPDQPDAGRPGIGGGSAVADHAKRKAPVHRDDDDG